MDTRSDPKAVPASPREEAELSPGGGKGPHARKEHGSVNAKMHSERKSATSRPRRLARAGEELAARQSGRREPGRLSRRPGNAGSSRRRSPDAEASAARPGLAYPTSRAQGTTTRIPRGAYCQSWSLLGVSGIGEWAWAFLAHTGVPRVILTKRDPWSPPLAEPQTKVWTRGVQHFLKARQGPWENSGLRPGSLGQLFI